MTFIESIQKCFKNFVVWRGRAQRSEFWWFALFAMAGSMILSIVDTSLFGETVVTDNGFSSSTDTPIFSGIFFLIIFLPYLSVIVRRLHDTNRSGWWYWIVLVPIIGFILIIVWAASKGTEGSNNYGADPLNGRNGDDGDDDYSRSSIPTVNRD
jgi:uncharacterized membrane protein YhaH (DUF805 family)